MSYFAAKMHQIRFRLGLRTPLGERTALPQTPLAGFKGPTSNGRGGRDWEGREVRRWGGEGNRGGVGEGRDPCFWVTPPEIES